ncbi:MAG TPA: hypothetical protein VGM44_07845 [Polyangiaceae bacterium]|jgi:hypothetical protein
MKVGKNARLRWALLPLFAGALFAGCSNSDDSSVAPPPGPPFVTITPPASTLGCDNSLVVELALTYFTPKPPYNCGTTPQCGSVQVSLLETADGMPLVSMRAATSAVQFDLTDLVTPPTADAPNLSQVHFIKAELLGDSLEPLAQSAGSQTSQEIPVSLSVPSCAADAGAEAGAGGASGASGSAGGEGGSGTAGEAGATSGGSSNSAGSGGSAGTAGSASAGAAGTDSGGSAGSGGDNGETGGSGGSI